MMTLINCKILSLGTFSKRFYYGKWYNEGDLVWMVVNNSKMRVEFPTVELQMHPTYDFCVILPICLLTCEEEFESL